MIIGICGQAGCGKSTAAGMLADRFGYVEVALADPLYDAVSAMFGIEQGSIRRKLLFVDRDEVVEA